MKRPMQGIRVVEVAQYTFVPASGGVLAEWGADVIKVEHAVTGDAQRGLIKTLGLDQVKDTASFFPIMEGPNRGKRSIGIALEVPEGRALLDELVRTADVFVTNFMQTARNRLRLNVEDIRAINPNIIYVRGTGYGAKGAVANEGGYDSTAYWARGGSADSSTPDGAERLTQMPTGAYGDLIGGLTIAGGIAAALFARLATGEPSVVDVSLLGVGAWAMQSSVNLALLTGGPLPKQPPAKNGTASNPLLGTFKSADGRWLTLVMLQPRRYWAEFCERMGRAELITDVRFAGDAIVSHGYEGGDIVAEIIGALTVQEWTRRMDGAAGQWALVQNAFEVGMDPALRENGFISQLIDYDGKQRELVTNPVQFDETSTQSRRAPQFAEHTDALLRELGLTDEQVIELKICGAVT